MRNTEKYAGKRVLVVGMARSGIAAAQLLCKAGAVSLIPLLDMALKVYHGPHTFDELGISAYEPQEGKA